MAEHACLKIAYESISMGYFDLPTLNSNVSTKSLRMRRLIIPTPDLMEITHGCYVLFYYVNTNFDQFPDRTYCSKSVGSLRRQFDCRTYLSGSKSGHHIVAKFTDSDFTLLTDITLEDLILFAPKKLLATELAEQLAIYKAS